MYPTSLSPSCRCVHLIPFRHSGEGCSHIQHHPQSLSSESQSSDSTPKLGSIPEKAAAYTSHDGNLLKRVTFKWHIVAVKKSLLQLERKRNPLLAKRVSVDICAHEERFLSFTNPTKACLHPCKRCSATELQCTELVMTVSLRNSSMGYWRVSQMPGEYTGISGWIAASWLSYVIFKCFSVQFPHVNWGVLLKMSQVYLCKGLEQCLACSQSPQMECSVEKNSEHGQSSKGFGTISSSLHILEWILVIVRWVYLFSS
jgi:hypothetical protein